MDLQNKYYCRQLNCGKQTLFKLFMRHHIKNVHRITDDSEIRKYIGYLRTLGHNNSKMTYEFDHNSNVPDSKY